MTRAARTPWPVATSALGTSVLILLVAAVWPTSPALPLAGRVAELALAGSAAYLLDDAAAPLTTVTPPGPWRRRAPVLACSVAVLGGAWLGVLLALRWRSAQPPIADASLELLVLGLVAVGAAALLLRLGEPEPGVVVAPAVVLLGLGLLIAESLVRSPIFLTDAEPTTGRVAGWTVAGVVAMLAILLGGRDPASRLDARRAGEPERVMRRARGRG